MDMDALAPYAPYLLQALGGAIGANILGVITRGGGGFVGRTLFGALGGLGSGYAVQEMPDLAAVAAHWSQLAPDPDGERLANMITGACGGGLVGLVTGLLIRPSSRG
jgi:hypothetical protein